MLNCTKKNGDFLNLYKYAVEKCSNFFFDISIWNYNNLITENNVMQIDDTSQNKIKLKTDQPSKIQKNNKL